MKTLLSLIAAILFCSMSLSAQRPVQDTIPQLQEWWRAPANEENIGLAVGWLPNFYNGRDAMAITTKNGTETWLNRFPGDRENVFTWKGAPPILRGDFNGDGITDYIDNSGSVYRGIQNGEPPEAEPVKRTRPISINTPMLVADVNKDGYDDAVVMVPDDDFESESLLLIYYGAKDFAGMDTLHTVMKSIMPISLKDTARTFRRIYKTKEGNIRLIVRFGKLLTKALPPYRDGFELYALDWDKGGLGATAKKLSEYIKDSPGGINKNESNFSNGYDALYQSTHHDKIFFLAVSEDQNKVTVFDVSEDTMLPEKVINVERCYYVIPLTHSIDGDIYEDFAIRQFASTSTTISFFSGGTELATKPFAFYKPTCDNPPIQVVSINDVSNDGIADIAIGIKPYQLSNCFRLVKSVTPVSIEEPSESITEFSLSGTTPHPVSTHALLKALVKNAGNYQVSLISLNGREIAEIFSGHIEKGECTLSLDFTDSFIVNGTYSVRMTNTMGRVIGERTIIINK